MSKLSERIRALECPHKPELEQEFEEMEYCEAFENGFNTAISAAAQLAESEGEELRTLVGELREAGRAVHLSLISPPGYPSCDETEALSAVLAKADKITKGESA